MGCQGSKKAKEEYPREYKPSTETGIKTIEEKKPPARELPRPPTEENDQDVGLGLFQAL